MVYSFTGCPKTIIFIEFKVLRLLFCIYLRYNMVYGYTGYPKAIKLIISMCHLCKANVILSEL